MKKEVKSNVLDLANRFLNEIDPPLLEGSEPKQIQSDELKAMALAIEQVASNVFNILDAKIETTNRAIMNITKVGLVKN